ncbi:hypothetical protein [Aquimarina sediminis]|uniref:hypothetical protein n=1 Tax=Aquimarina sediminis TaxID=2070536 RepID=UPI000FFE384C|nr:hypothetical protein [Aquimarina sediminis]
MKINFICLVLFMNQSFEVLKSGDPRIIEMLESHISSEVCEFNKANIYELPDNKYLVIPQEPGKYNLLYYSRSELDKHIAEQYFPVNDYEMDDLVEPEKKNIENIAENIHIYIDYIEQKFDIQGSFSDNTSYLLKLKRLDQKIQSYGVSKLLEYDILAIGLYLNEMFRLDTKLIWNLEKVYSLNPYWYPNLVDHNGLKYDVAGVMYKSYFDYNYIDVILHYKLEKAKLLGYEPFSEEHFLYLNSDTLN